MTYDVSGTIEYYKNLLLYQYNDKPRARETIGLLADAALCDLVVLEINDAFNIETAVGPQLDVLGEYIGFSRLVPISLPQPYFQFDDYITPIVSPVGFTDYTDSLINEDSVFYLYLFVNTSFNELTDVQYRYMLKLKIVLNTLFNSLSNIDKALFDFFGQSIYCFDQTDMTMNYFIQGAPTYLLQAAYDLNLLPKPMGVRISGVFSVPDATKIMKMARYEYDTGADIEFCNYATGFNDKSLLNYLDRVT
jgi:hypothetical protein